MGDLGCVVADCCLCCRMLGCCGVLMWLWWLYDWWWFVGLYYCVCVLGLRLGKLVGLLVLLAAWWWLVFGFDYVEWCR